MLSASIFSALVRALISASLSFSASISALVYNLVLQRRVGEDLLMEVDSAHALFLRTVGVR